MSDGQLFDTSIDSMPQRIDWTADMEGIDYEAWQQPRKSNERSEQPDDIGRNSSADKVEQPEVIDSAGLSTTPRPNTVQSENETIPALLIGDRKGESIICARSASKPPFAIAPQPQLPESAPTVATLCTGGGLFEVGAMMAGFRPIWGVESDPDNPDASSQIADCYERNFGAHIIRETVEEVASVGFKHLASNCPPRLPAL